MGQTTKSGRSRNRRVRQQQEIRAELQPPLILYGLAQVTLSEIRCLVLNWNGEQQTDMRVQPGATAIVGVAFSGTVETVQIGWDAVSGELVFTFATPHDAPDATTFLGSTTGVLGPNGEEIAAAFYEWT